MKVSSDFSNGHLDRHSPPARLPIFDVFPGGLRRRGRSDSELAKQTLSSPAPKSDIGPLGHVPARADCHTSGALGQVAEPTKGRLLVRGCLRLRPVFPYSHALATVRRAGAQLVQERVLGFLFRASPSF